MEAVQATALTMLRDYLVPSTKKLFKTEMLGESRFRKQILGSLALTKLVDRVQHYSL